MSTIPDGDTTMTTKKTALVLGATGGIGGEVTRALLQRGWTVRALSRQADRMAKSDTLGVIWLAGDAMQQADVVAAAKDAALIVHAVNPPAYRNWDTLVMPMLENSIAAAKVHGGRILLPGTLYNFGEAEFPEIREDAPQQPHTCKGAIRVQMESRLRQVAVDGVRTLIVRAGDYFGPRAGSSWFSMMVKAGRPVTSVTTIGSVGIGHQWGYLPDVAETMVRLVEREDSLRTFESVHMAGHWDDDGTRMAAAIKRVVGNPTLRTASFPWWAVELTWPFVRLFREVREMRYLWKRPIRLCNDRLIELLGQEPHTPLDTAMRTVLVGQGCLAAKGKETVAIAR